MHNITLTYSTILVAIVHTEICAIVVSTTSIFILIIQNYFLVLSSLTLLLGKKMSLFFLIIFFIIDASLIHNPFISDDSLILSTKPLKDFPKALDNKLFRASAKLFIIFDIKLDTLVKVILA